MPVFREVDALRIHRNSKVIPIEYMLQLKQDSLLEVFRNAALCARRGRRALLLAEPVRMTVWYRSRKVWRIMGIGSLVLEAPCLDIGGLELLEDAWGEAVRLTPFYLPGSMGAPLRLAEAIGFTESEGSECLLGIEDQAAHVFSVLWEPCPEGRSVRGTVSSMDPLALPANHMVGLEMGARLCGCREDGEEIIAEISGVPLITCWGRRIRLCGELEDRVRDTLTRILTLVWACGDKRWTR